MTTADSAYALQVAFDNLRKSKPKKLSAAMEIMATMQDIELPPNALTAAIEHIAAAGPNDAALNSLTLTIQAWDHDPAPDWAAGTVQHTEARRERILELLELEETQRVIIDARVRRFSFLDMPIVIATEHEPWYEERKRRITDFYWKDYVGQLLPPKGKWSTEAVSALNTSVEDVVSRLSDPSREAIYPVKGLVVGYVQSGKTSHFSGLLAKAADAGYRLVIVLAGTLDILRMQTQRRIDKEIIGRELLGAEEYGRDPDWSEFVSHGSRPSLIGAFDWERLTNRDDDYQVLRRHLGALEFRSYDRSKPFNDPVNLSSAPVRLAVIKKNPTRLNALCEDLEALRELRSKLDHVPTLVIDDESDQASINTVQRPANDEREFRSKTNAAIGRLLRLMPRAQYVGYTATPFANVFIDPDDAEDLFPKDFIISLPRPKGYMGVADFYDFNEDYEHGDFRGNCNAFVRPVEGDNSHANNLPKAIDSFVLSGAIKLFRAAQDSARFRFRHHTMLVHHSATRVVHENDRQMVEQLFQNGARYQKSEGLRVLAELYSNDFEPVSVTRGDGAPIPATFDELKPYIAKCVSLICKDKPVRVVNGDNLDDTPNFDEVDVWAILVGGTKLSRGYTVEGLTISYYRRPTGAGDTLLQMGRWFGFRDGYRDLVRLFIGRKEQKGRTTIDLYEAFGAVCRDEEALRTDLTKYARLGLKPYQVPPLVRQHLPELPPTSKNKMYNAEINSIDFSGEWTEKTSAPTLPSERAHNRNAAARLLNSATLSEVEEVQFVNPVGVKRSFECTFGLLDGTAVLGFLETYKWADARDSVKLELKFIVSATQGRRLQRWLLMLPLVRQRRRFDVPLTALEEIPVIERRRVSDHRFGVYSEPRHREAAAYLAGVAAVSDPSPPLASRRSEDQPVLILYFVAETGAEDLSVGFGVQYPGVKRTNPITWTVKDNQAGAILPLSR